MIADSDYPGYWISRNIIHYLTAQDQQIMSPDMEWRANGLRER